jgi:hypothetical protein
MMQFYIIGIVIIGCGSVILIGVGTLISDLLKKRRRHSMLGTKIKKQPTEHPSDDYSHMFNGF